MPLTLLSLDKKKIEEEVTSSASLKLKHSTATVVHLLLANRYLLRFNIWTVFVSPADSYRRTKDITG